MAAGTEAPAVASMTEAELLECVIETAHLFGWRVAHFRPAMTKHGWRTAVSADGAGWPDVSMVRGNRLVIAECKSAKGTLSPAQQEWLRVLDNVAEVYLWRPCDWQDGSVERVLRGKR